MVFFVFCCLILHYPACSVLSMVHK